MAQRKSENDIACLKLKQVSPKLLPFIELIAAQMAREELDRLKKVKPVHCA